MAADEIWVIYRKYDGSLHWHQPMRWLGEDEHGTWLGADAGAIARKGDDGPDVVVKQPHVMLFPRDAWWTAVFNGPPERVEIYCDITTPARWPHPGEVTMVDLDLDVCRIRADHRVELLDEDEFAEHQVRYRYPDEAIRHATETAEWLQAALADGTQPFTSSYLTWLAHVH